MTAIQNNVQVIDSKSMKTIKNEIIPSQDVLFVELDGSTIQSWEDYALAMGKEFLFPTSCVDSVDRYLDWMKDLEWLNKEIYVLVIHNYQQFFKDDINAKNEIIADFTEDILPFWEREVEEVMVGGKAKSFMVYLVE